MATDGMLEPNEHEPASIWDPADHNVENTLLAKFVEYVEAEYGQSFSRPFDQDCYMALHAWSVGAKEDFWNAVWDFTDVVGDKGEITMEEIDQPPYFRFFSDAEISYTENML